MTKLQIIGAAQSPFVWTTRLAAAEKRIDFETVRAPPHSPEILAINPFGKIPAMRHGDIALSESRAIVAYIDQAFEGPILTPVNPLAAAIMEQWVSRILTEMHPVMTGDYITQYFFPRGPGGAPDRAVIDKAARQIAMHADLLETAVERSPFLACATLSVADLYIYPLLSYLRDLPESSEILATKPAIGAYFNRLSAREAFKAVKPAPLSDEDRARGASLLSERAA